MSTSRTETADKPNDSQDSSCEQFQSMAKVGNSNSSGMTSAEEIPNAAMKTQLENAKKLMLQFQTFYYDGTAGTHIPPFLEHWIFFALFILLIPDHLSKLSEKLCFDGENIPVLTGYLPMSAATAKGKQTFKKNMEIFTRMCNGKDIPYCIEAKKNRPGYLALVPKTTVATGEIGASDEASTGGEVVGMTFLLTTGQLKQFSSHSARELRRCILLVKATEWGQPPNKMYLVAGPIVFLSHCCDASTKPTWCDRRGDVVGTLTKLVPQSSCGLFLPRACLQINAFGEGIVSLADSPWSQSECECATCKSPGLAVEKAATSTSIVNLGDLSQSMKSTSSNDSKDTDEGGRYHHTGDLTLFGDESFPVALTILHEVIGIESSPRFPRRKLTSTDLATVEQSIITRNQDYEAKDTRFTLVSASEFQKQQQTLCKFLEAMKAARDKDDGNDAGIKFPSELSLADFLFVCHRSYGIPGVDFPTCKIDESNRAAVEADVVAMEFKTRTIASSDRSRDARGLKAFVNSLRRLLSSLDQSTALTKPINGKSQPQMQPSADADRLMKQRVEDDDTELKLPATSPVSSSSHPLGKSRDSSTPLANFASPTVRLSLLRDDDTELKLPATSPVSSSSHPIVQKLPRSQQSLPIERQMKIIADESNPVYRHREKCLVGGVRKQRGVEMGFTHQSREAGGLEIEIPSNQDESPIIVSRDKGNKCKTKQDFRSEKVRKQIEYLRENADASTYVPFTVGSKKRDKDGNPKYQTDYADWGRWMRRFRTKA